MDIKNFKAGTYKKQYAYQSFSPNPVNAEWIVTEPKLLSLLSEADRKLGELNAASRWQQDIRFVIAMHIAKEATTSSHIEGTQTTMEEAFTQAGDIDPDRRDDWTEVHNYIRAMDRAIAALKKLPITGRLLRNAHKRLLEGVRGKHKNPGEYRSSQNWLGTSLANAAYIPPVHTEAKELMSDLEKFINNEKISVTPLVRIAIAHYQFETIHPFLDGNGRLGRLLITLYLVSAGILEKPTLYLSDFFERNRLDYYDHLTRAREKNDLAGWIRFFLAGVIETSKNSIRTFEQIYLLRKKIEAEKIPKLGKRAKHGKELLQFLYSQPVVDREVVQKNLELSTSTASRLLGDFVNLGILRETTGYLRNRRYAFREYLAIFSDH
jgi:Fic family protein